MEAEARGRSVNDRDDERDLRPPGAGDDRDLLPPEPAIPPGPGSGRRGGQRGRGGSSRQDLLAGADPTWVKAPLILARFPGLLLAILATAVVLGVTSAAGPMFLSSAGSEAVRLEIGERSRASAGLTVVAHGRFLARDPEADDLDGRALFDRRDAFLREATAGLTALDPQDLTILGPEVTLGSTGGPVGRVLSRTGLPDGLDGGAAGGASGLWVPEDLAGDLGIGPGDEVAVVSPAGRIDVTVAGTFTDPITLPEADRAVIGDASPLVADTGTLFEVGGELEALGLFTWRFPVAAEAVPLPQAREVAARIEAVRDRLRDLTDPAVAGPFSGAASVSEMPEIVDRAGAAVANLRGPVGAVTLAGQVLALAVLAGAAVHGVRRRRAEIELMTARGVSPSAIGLRWTLAALGPVAAGAVSGWLLAERVVEWLGPGALEDPTAVRSALWRVGVSAVAGVALLGVATAVTAREEARENEPGRVRDLAARAPWEVPALLFAAAALYEIGRRDASSPSGQAPAVDPLLLLFPILFIGGLAGLLTRLVGRVLPRLRAWSGRSASLFLASRRVASAGRAALLAVTAGAVALGLLVYAGSLAVSARATAAATARVTLGSDVRVDLERGDPPPRGLAFPSTAVVRIRGGQVLPSEEDLEVLAVDRRTFAGAAFWDDGFADRSLEELLASIATVGSDGRVPVVATGGRMPPSPTLDLGEARVPIRAVASVRALPGMPPTGLVVLADAGVLGPALEAQDSSIDAHGRPELWVRGDPQVAAAALGDAGTRPEAVRTVADETATLQFAAAGWTFGLLQAVGVLAGLVAVAGMLLYLQARQRAREVGFAISSRMGLSGPAHTRSVLVEIAALLGLSFLVGGVLAFGAVRLVGSQLDVLPSLPPPPVIRAPWVLLTATGAALAAVAVVAAWRIQRSAERTNVAEVMRLAG
jgi:putative ABC transport system permease protein